MMRVQLLRYSKYSSRSSWYQNESPANSENASVFSFGQLAVKELKLPDDFDAFDVNVICLDDKGFWRNDSGASTEVVNSQEDLEGLAYLYGSTRSIVVLVLPSENIDFTYKGRSDYGDQRSKIPIKNILDDVIRVAYQAVGTWSFDSSLICASGTTTLGDVELTSSFYFESGSNAVATMTNPPSRKATTMRSDNLAITVLPILESENAFAAFLSLLAETEKSEDPPSWFPELPPMFDDTELLKEIERQNAIVEEALGKIAVAQKLLDSNDELKSILYTNGRALEDSVRKILGELFSWNPNAFEDMGTSDFIIEQGGAYYVGEIKGENSNVINSHLSQLALNYDLDVESGRIPEECVSHKLLIANTFRKKPPHKRPAVDEKQIKLAREKFDCLIVTTPVLLKLLELVRSGDIARQDVAKLLTKTGILLESDLGA